MAGGRSWLLAEGVLVVVHPHLEHVALDADLLAELLHGGLVVLLDAPPQPLRERQHPVLLLLRELGAEPLLAGPRAAGRAPRRAAARAQRHAHHGRHHHGADQPGHVVALFAPQRVGGGRQRERALHVPGGGRQLLVQEVPGRGAVVGGELVVVRRHGGAVGCDGGRGQGGGGIGRRDAPASRWRVVGLLAVEVAVAAAGRAAQRVDGALLASGHEFAAAVHRVPADADRVVLEALPVPGGPATACACACACASSPEAACWRRPEAPGSSRIPVLRGLAASSAQSQPRLHRRIVARAHGHRRHLLVAVIVLVEVHGG
uniref:Uncharacterized protein n=1 Tax=Zea mays TaxID=4577 RepID=A0A804LUZ5_MAIZE